MSDDRQRALARAEQARQAIAEIVRAVQSQELDLAGAFALADANPLMGRCFAVKVFEVVPHIGKVRARHTMADLGLDEGIWLDQVPADKRVAVIEAFATEPPA